MGRSPGGCKELDTTERLTRSLPFFSRIVSASTLHRYVTPLLVTECYSAVWMVRLVFTHLPLDGYLDCQFFLSLWCHYIPLRRAFYTLLSTTDLEYDFLNFFLDLQAVHPPRISLKHERTANLHIACMTVCEKEMCSIHPQPPPLPNLCHLTDCVNHIWLIAFIGHSSLHRIV